MSSLNFWLKANFQIRRFQVRRFLILPAGTASCESHQWETREFGYHAHTWPQHAVIPNVCSFKKIKSIKRGLFRKHIPSTYTQYIMVFMSYDIRIASWPQNRKRMFGRDFWASRRLLPGVIRKEVLLLKIFWCEDVLKLKFCWILQLKELKLPAWRAKDFLGAKKFGPWRLRLNFFNTFYLCEKVDEFGDSKLLVQK